MLISKVVAKSANVVRSCTYSLYGDGLLFNGRRASAKRLRHSPGLRSGSTNTA